MFRRPSTSVPVSIEALGCELVAVWSLGVVKNPPKASFCDVSLEAVETNEGVSRCDGIKRAWG
jgi:hypothetical protein